MLPTTDQYEVPCSKEGTPAMWFSNRQADVEACKKICGTCRVRLACLSSAIDYEAQTGTAMVGTHGGMSVKERRRSTLKRIA